MKNLKLEQRHRRESFLGLCVLVLMTGCGSPLAVSDYISLKLSGIKDGDIRNGQVSEEKNVNTEEGNPYSEFLRVVGEELDGAAPSRIEVESVGLQVHSDSKGVSDLETVFQSLEVFVATGETIATVGYIEVVSGSTVTLDDIQNGSLDTVQAALIEGNFKMGVRGTVHETLPDDFELKISMDVQFSAYP